MTTKEGEDFVCVCVTHPENLCATEQVTARIGVGDGETLDRRLRGTRLVRETGETFAFAVSAEITPTSRLTTWRAEIADGDILNIPQDRVSTARFPAPFDEVLYYGDVLFAKVSTSAEGGGFEFEGLSIRGLSSALAQFPQTQ